MFEVDFTNIHSIEEFHLSAQKIFSFPDYYGKNFAAFQDCIPGLFLKFQTNEITISFKNTDKFIKLNPEHKRFLGTILDILKQESEKYLLRDKKLNIVVE